MKTERDKGREIQYRSPYYLCNSIPQGKHSTPSPSHPSHHSHYQLWYQLCNFQVLEFSSVTKDLREISFYIFWFTNILQQQLVLILASIPILKTMLSTKSMYDNYIGKEIILFIQKENSRGVILESLFLCWSVLHRVFSIPTASQYWIGIYKISVSWGNSRASLCHC